MRFPFRSFYWRLVFILFFLLFTTTGTLFFINFQIEKKVLTDQIRQRALLMGKTLQLNLSQLILKSSLKDLESIPGDEKRQIRNFIQHFGEEENPLDVFSKNEGFHDLFLLNADSRVIIDYPEEKEGRTLPPKEKINTEALALLSRNEIMTDILIRNRESVLVLTFPLFQEKRLLGFGRIEMSMKPVETLLNQIKRWAMGAAGGLLLIVVMFAVYQAGSFTRPIGELVRAANQIGKGDFSARLDSSRKDEIGALMNTFNQMAEGIQKLEETQKRVEKLEVAGHLAAGVAHEIKNPLNSLGLIMDHFKDRYSGSIDVSSRKKFIELTENMKQEVNRLNEIVEGFLRFAKPASLFRQQIDLNELIEETLVFMTAEAERRQVKLFKRLDPKIPGLSIDSQQVRQALLNLLINAFQAMPEGGELKVETSAVLSPERTEVCISIQDTGCGITEENLGRLFEPYFTTRSGGFGLGLAIVDRIIRDHGGRIEVTSLPAKGSCFKLFFPLSGEVRNA